MKVLLVNGSPHQKGCVFTALTEISKTLAEQGIESEIFHIGSSPVQGCVACYACQKTPRGAFLKISFTLILSTGSKIATGS